MALMREKQVESKKMLRFSAIDNKLTIYREHQVILFGAGVHGRRLLDVFLRLGIIPYAFCDNAHEKQGTKINGIPVISPTDLMRIENHVVQISTESESEIAGQLMSMGIECFVLMTEFDQRIYDLGRYNLLDTDQKKRGYYTQSGILDILKTRNEWPLWDYIFKSSLLDVQDFLILCMPPKTGDWTMNATLNCYKKEYVNLWHSFRHITAQMQDALKDKRLKIISAVREPIQQNISAFFNMSDTFWDEPKYWENGGDVQLLFDTWIASELGENITFQSLSSEMKKIKFSYFKAFKESEGIDYLIQNWFENQFQKYTGINVYDFPFDREAGYTIISVPEADIFIYQLEKMDKIRDLLGSFLGINEFVLRKDNVSANKWYATAYRRIQDELILSREYLEKAYSSRLARHFYSDSDIDRFRKCWEKCVR